ncbi:predicted protein [Scheffersomyces stipitis CBS 6054]|uniref:FAD/NAD(P)-binding domain-containing protein n=1 Tax=Scheffersomyces stipitis (strain ATCC 58785 / CBS 6054 / NBRC 10063 / NRRL Y-11545) TaxID=322104 RepID=A3LTK6_PICST|nr:predicted protein [Scheffersomyces stipitis CBS 6054]ABN66427.2 predicted protein [Scheffersomyces stipitis CBS 6054]KAG2732763.1 hypothetical protein G9P44_003753 [Scheffersomyces stipitis]
MTPISEITALTLKTNILIVGGAYAGLAAINQFRKRLDSNFSDSNDKKISLTLVEPRAGFLNILGIPKCIVNPEFARNQYITFERFPYLQFDKVYSIDKKMQQQLQEERTKPQPFELDFIHGKINYLDEKSATFTLTGGKEKSKIDFDYVILASGRSRQWPSTPNAFNIEYFMKEMNDTHKKISESNTISIIGAGAVGIELAGEIKAEFPEKSVNLIHPHPSFPPEPLSEEFQDKVKKGLEDAGVNLLLNSRIDREFGNGNLQTTDGEFIESDLNYWCTSHKNNIDFLSEEICSFLTAKKDLAVNEYLQVADTDIVLPNVFATGDLVDLDVIKSAGWALHMGPIAADNIINLIMGEEPNSKLPDVSLWEKNIALAVGNGEIISGNGNTVEINNSDYVEIYKDYGLNRCLEMLEAELRE